MLVPQVNIANPRSGFLLVRLQMLNTIGQQMAAVANGLDPIRPRMAAMIRIVNGMNAG